uniref:Eukaryotic translation initiation factor 2D n=1 Tax=Tanacetum cinerariifolium TaxID=118510 RepID=A0A699GXQ3_TANCI|nr:eukaryotic translation initiation factor 2D [Tanacetum cinerariifolium]
MFKKTVESKSQQRLSGADRKKLKRTITERFPNASDTDLDTLIPPKVEVTVSKHPNRVLIYSLEGGLPIFFDVDSRGTTIFPTAIHMVTYNNNNLPNPAGAGYSYSHGNIQQQQQLTQSRRSRVWGR